MYIRLALCVTALPCKKLIDHNFGHVHSYVST